MEEKSKPKVFLSHSTKDRAFIEKLYQDLKKYKIEPWKDTEEIRDGKSWLKIIFEDGIPTCDSLIVYLTKNSINSKMVSKEIDSAFVEQLSDNGIAILPYVDDARIRTKLRPDIKSLQCREWNDTNYSALLPSVVAEIWQNYVEKIVSEVVRKEKDEKKSVEEKYKKLITKTNTSPFTKSQKKDFEYIKKYLNDNVFVTIRTSKYINDEMLDSLPSHDEVCSCPFLELLFRYVNKGYDIYSFDKFKSFVTKLLPKKFFETNDEKEDKHVYQIEPNFTTKLRTVGLTKPSSSNIDSFSNKMYRFNYWLGYNKLYKNDLEFKNIEKREFSFSKPKR